MKSPRELGQHLVRAFLLHYIKAKEITEREKAWFAYNATNPTY